MVFSSFITGIVGSNSARVKDLCVNFSVLCCRMELEVFRWSIPHPRIPAEFLDGLVVSEVNSE